MKCLFFVVSVSLPLLAENLDGIYKTQAFLYMKSSYVEFFKYGDHYYAYGIANTDGSPAGKDIYNKDPALRERSDKGVVFLYGLTRVCGNTYKNGKAYNFYDGRTYYVQIHQDKNGDLKFLPSLDRRGFFGKTFIWKRIDEAYLKKRGIKKPDFSGVLQTLKQLPNGS
ncbi:DUF2147 domain-containing protein [Helicobacter ailurogastricus]|uniref:DUF2147 domain-containing protein n=1 Tax=Helicobacter ailurogastricus TaxID=1578720 RepID=UPI000CF0EDC2|nr:DUF2147 domain-containing protein [Helicobacter ailurogastricus]